MKVSDVIKAGNKMDSLAKDQKEAILEIIDLKTEEDMNNALSKIDTQFSKVDAQFSKIDAHLSKIDAQFIGLKNELSVQRNLVWGVLITLSIGILLVIIESIISKR